MIKAAKILKEHGPKFKQITKVYASDVYENGRCALGVLMDVATTSRNHWFVHSSVLEEALPCLYRPAPPCPIAPCPAHDDVKKLPDNGLHTSFEGEENERHPWRFKLANLITHLNDDHLLTFGEIADFLATLPDEESSKSCDAGACDYEKEG